MLCWVEFIHMGVRARKAVNEVSECIAADGQGRLDCCLHMVVMECKLQLQNIQVACGCAMHVVSRCCLRAIIEK